MQTRGKGSKEATFTIGKGRKTGVSLVRNSYVQKNNK